MGQMGLMGHMFFGKMLNAGMDSKRGRIKRER